MAGSPTILNRQISTSLTLRDGGSLRMGGLISGNQGAGTTGVPVLGQLPVLGRLFRTDAVQEDRTELMVMVTPYVIADHEEGWELTRRIREQFDLHHRDSAMTRSAMGVRCPRTGARFQTAAGGARTGHGGFLPPTVRLRRDRIAGSAGVRPMEALVAARSPPSSRQQRLASGRNP